MRLIIKSLNGNPGITPLTLEDVESIILNYQQRLENLEPSTMDRVLQGVGYVLNPYQAVSDYIQTADWAPNWLKNVSPYIAMAAPGKPKKPGKVGGKAGYKGTLATTSNPAAKRGNSAAVQKNLDLWGNMEVTGSVYGDRTPGGFRVVNGDVVLTGNVGRPIKSSLVKTAMKNDAKLSLAPTKIVNTTHVRRPETVNGRGRISKEGFDRIFEHFDNLSVTVPRRSSLTGNALRLTINRFKHWYLYGNNRTLQFLEEIANGNRASLLKLGLLRQRMAGIEKKMRNQGWNPEDFKLKK